METEYEVVRSKRKTLAVHISNDGKVTVKAPLKLSDDKILSFLNEKERWISKTLQKVRAEFVNPLNKNFNAGGEFLIFGNPYTVSYYSGKKVALSNNLILIPSSKDIKTALIKFYKALAKTYLEARLQELSNALKINYKSFALTSAKSKWGSCSADNAIRLNYKLVLTPKACIDYVIVHELTHVKVKDHSKRFWQRVEAVMPNYKPLRKWLKDNGTSIINIDKI